MSATVILIDVFAAVLIFAGFNMAFQQAAVRRLLRSRQLPASGDEDSTTYVLRIVGTMLMAFGAALAMFFTSFAHFSR